MTSIYDYPWAAILRYHNDRKQSESWGCSGAYIGLTIQLFIEQ